jgi:predicted metal-dependent phosphotriesterase family hydrolase
MTYLQTVLGRVPVEAIGLTLPHEHLFLEMWGSGGRGSMLQVSDEELLLAELEAYVAAGGTCLVDQTPRGCGRDPVRVRRLAERTGLSVVMACGWYTEPFYPAADDLARRSVDAIADQLLTEINEGMDGTDVLPGVIGEIGVAQGWLSPLEERVHRAAARAQRASGLSLATHTLHRGAGLAQLDLFAEEGVDLSRVCIGHCDSQPYLDYCLSIAERGAWVAFDNIGAQMGRLEERIIWLVKELVARGHEGQILLSHDVGQMPELSYFGGPGFTYLTRVFIPALVSAGVPRAVIAELTESNPARFLAVS